MHTTQELFYCYIFKIETPIYRRCFNIIDIMNFLFLSELPCWFISNLLWNLGQEMPCEYPNVCIWINVDHRNCLYYVLVINPIMAMFFMKLSVLKLKIYYICYYYFQIKTHASITMINFCMFPLLHAIFAGISIDIDEHFNDYYTRTQKLMIIDTTCAALVGGLQLVGCILHFKACSKKPVRY